MDLVTFLLARIAEDEAYARNAFGDHNDAKPEWTEIWSGAVDLGDGEDLLITNDSQVSRHIERHDPARVLAECDAKRQIVDLLAIAERHLDEARRIAPEYQLVAAAEAPRDALLLAVQRLALPYANHPDYRDKWKL